jgi:hypothetical protein
VNNEKKPIARDGHENVRSALDQSARRSVNALDVSSSLVSALIRNPGPAGSRQAVVLAAKMMLRSADEATHKLLEALDLQSVPWAQYRVMKAVTQAVSDTWRSTSDADKASADVSALLPVWEAICRGLDIPDPRPDSADERVLLQVSLLDAMQPVVREIASFPLFHDERRAATHARNRMLSAARSASRTLQGGRPIGSGQDHLMAALLRNAGTIYASSWRKQAENVKRVLAEMSPEHQSEMASRYPEGFPLEVVDKGFAESFQKLTELAQVLAPPVRRGRGDAGTREAEDPTAPSRAK